MRQTNIFIQSSFLDMDTNNNELDVVGVDEAGRGPLAGDVYAAAVILDPLNPIAGLMDSKQLSETKRDALAIEIKQKAKAWCIASASVEEIDKFNILQATMLAMTRAVEGLGLTQIQVLVDGNRLPKWSYSSRAIVKGDQLEACISAASILAKTARDESLYALDKCYPHYSFAQHKGYGTRLHLDALAQYGPCPSHRRSFAPVKKLLNTD